MTPRVPRERPGIESVRRYWSEHLNLTQFLPETIYEPGTPEFFRAVRASVLRFPYKQALADRIWEGRVGTRLLEIGCGLGADLIDLARRGFHPTGIELSQEAAAMAERHLRLLGLPGVVLMGDAETLPLRSNSVDEVYSSGVFQHTPRPQAAVDEAFRVLKPGGHMTVVLYHRHSWFWLLSRLSRANVEFQVEEAPIVDAYSRSELKQMFARLEGLEIWLEHFRPLRTPRRGLLAALYNGVLVPAGARMPAPLLRPFGFHAVIRGRKG